MRFHGHLVRVAGPGNGARRVGKNLRDTTLVGLAVQAGVPLPRVGLSRVARCFRTGSDAAAPPDTVPCRPGALTMAAYASDRASSHRSISERSQPIAREFGPPSRTDFGESPVRYASP